eukprot:1153681-Pelagomonas_calceolata.AAC.2
MQDYCYFCKDPGHMAKDCPQKSRQGNQGFKRRAPDSGPRNQGGRIHRNQGGGSRSSKSFGYVLDVALGVGAQEPLESSEGWAVKRKTGVGESCKNGKTPVLSSVPPAVHTLGATKHTGGLKFIFKGVFGGVQCSVFFDTGASSCFVSETWVKKAMEKGKPTVTVRTLANPISIKVANNEQFFFSEQ